MSEKRVIIGSDHAGYAMKEQFKQHLAVKGYEVVDVGTDSLDSCDYPAIAKSLSAKVLEENGKGILVCGTGIGMSMAANRFSGIRAAVCANEFQAYATRLHNDANVLCVGERVTGIGAALSILDIFMETEFEGGRHQRRVDLIELD